jgi:hypothetical protein
MLDEAEDLPTRHSEPGGDLGKSPPGMNET